MRTVWFNKQGELRNGWKALAFFLITASIIFATTPLVKLALPWLKAHRGLIPMTLVSSLVVLLSSWLCLKAEKASLASLGLRLNRRWAREAFLGAGLGMGLIGLSALAIRALGGFHWELATGYGWRTLLAGVWVYVTVACFEELVFRGYPFQRLVRGLGIWPTQLLLAALFALAHWGNPGMHGTAKVWASLNIALAAVLLGLAYLKTGSLALPIGLHFGWNWMQGELLGFGVSGTSTTTALLKPVFHGRPEWLTGGAFGPEASLPCLVVMVLCIGWMVRWQRLPDPAI